MEITSYIGQDTNILNRHYLPDPEYIDKNNLAEILNQRNQIHPEIREAYNIDKVSERVANELLTQVAAIEAKAIRGVIVFDADEIDDEIDEWTFISVLNNLEACFYINPYVTTWILRSRISGSHSKALCKIRNIKWQIINNLFSYASYDVSEDELESFSKNKELIKLLKLRGFLWILNKLDSTTRLLKNNFVIKDYYSDLPYEKFYSIVLEVYYYTVNDILWEKVFFIKNEPCYNFYFYKRLIESNKIPDRVKYYLLNQRDDKIRSIFKELLNSLNEANWNNPDINYLTVTDPIEREKSVVDQVWDIVAWWKLEEKIVELPDDPDIPEKKNVILDHRNREMNNSAYIDNVKKQNNHLDSTYLTAREPISEQEGAQATIIVWDDKLELSKMATAIVNIWWGKHFWKTYNSVWYSVLVALPDEDRKTVFKEIIEANFNAWVALLRHNWRHVVNSKLIVPLDDHLLVRILTEWLYIPDNFSDTYDSFMQVDCFCITRVMTLIPFERLEWLVKGLDVAHFRSIFYIIFYLRDFKEYPTSRFRHFCRDAEIDWSKIKRALIMIHNEDKVMYDWIQANVIKGNTIAENKFDYNLLMLDDSWFEVSLDNDSIIDTILKKNSTSLKAISLSIMGIIGNEESDLNKTIGLLSRLNSFIEIVISWWGELSTFSAEWEEEKIKIEEKKVLIYIDKLINTLDGLVISPKLREKLLWEVEESKVLLRNLALFLWRKSLEEREYFNLEPKLKYSNWVSGRIRLITDSEQLRYLREDDIVVLDDHPTTYWDLINEKKPRAIIMSSDKWVWSHTYNYIKKANIPVYYLPLAEQYLNWSNWAEIDIDRDWIITIIEWNKYILPNGEDNLWSKYMWLRGSSLPPAPLSWSSFYNVIQDYYGDIKSLWDADDLKNKVFLPWEELRVLFDNINNYGDIDYDDLSQKSIAILDSIQIKDEYIDTLNISSYPVALRSDFLNEDFDWFRTPWMKHSYLNIRNREEFKEALLEMIKQDFSPEALQYKINNSIYPAYCTFWAIAQEMLITEEKEAEDLLSGTATISNIDWKLIISTNLCLWLNEWITSWIAWTNCEMYDLQVEKIFEQDKYVTIDEENGWTKEVLLEDDNKNFQVSTETTEFLLAEFEKLASWLKEENILGLEFSVKNVL